ncbi:MAG TPA: TonB-dependent receptor [Vicinamibacterales bacterium]|jgi:hypothetical protein|nr:TonB-dependent receptor [Vicinamibacterales bacterium]
MRLRTLAIVAAAVLAATTATAQVQRGTIEGVVKDTSGAVLPGVTIEAKSAAGAALSTVSDATGTFRFPSVQPGVYQVSATLAGFRSASVPNVDVALGAIRKVDFALAVAGVAETVNVVAESPVVDTRQNTRSTDIRAEQIDLLPHGRDFTTLVTQAPGANNEAKLGGLSIDGASAGENRYIVDGMETTNLQNGLSGKGVIADFVEEVQVHSSGYTAEYGGAMGGVINVVTRSGSNDWHGYGLFNWQGDTLEKGRSLTGRTGYPTLRQNLNDSNIAEYITYPEDSYNRVEPSAAGGGPLSKNRAWFFAAYQPVIIPMERTLTPLGSTSPVTVKRTDQVQNIIANQTAQLGADLRSRVAFNNSWSKQRGILPTLDGTDPVGTNYAKTSTFPNWTLSGNVDWVASPKVFFGVRGGYYDSDQHDSNVTEEPRIIFSNTTNIGLPGVPATLQRATNFASIPAGANNKVERDQQTRAYFQADATWYGRLGGQHQFKFGVQADRLGNSVLSGEARNRVTIRWDTPLPSGRPLTRGPFGYYSVRSNAVDPKKGFITEGDVHTTNIGLFVQDAWTVASRLTINAGLRTERERVPTYTSGVDIPKFGVDFSFKDKLAPRVGFAYDVRGDGRTKAFGSWGIFYDIFKLELPRGSFGGDKWLEYYYTLDTPDWTTLVSSSGCPPACAGTLIRGPIDFRHPSFGSDAIEPALKPMKQQEATFGVDHELANHMAASVRYVHKQLDRAIDDTGSLDDQGNEIYIIANPGEGLTKLAFAGVAMPLPQRDYDSVEFALERRLSNNWFLRTSYLWSRLFGNYTGLSQSDENGRTSPNVGRAYDFPLMMFTGTGQASYGRLPTDRPHQFKTQFIYVFPTGTSVGLNEYVASGIPMTREIGVIPPSNYPVQYLGRFSDGRTDMYSQTDLYVQHEIKLAGTRRLQFNANVQNLFNQQAATSKFTTQQKSTSLTIDEAPFYAGRLNFATLIQQQNIAIDPRFLLNSDFQLPITARVGVKILF